MQDRNEQRTTTNDNNKLTSPEGENTPHSHFSRSVEVLGNIFSTQIAAR